MRVKLSSDNGSGPWVSRQRPSRESTGQDGIQHDKEIATTLDLCQSWGRSINYSGMKGGECPILRG